ncbi:MAG: ribonuclease J [Clostridiales bacterium]|nr:ribonuclease J [Clostridiales bacterium]MDY4895685.1 ribonuclease J [Eubacteriales bacterium]MCI6961123.1 ribonuclease J [Clostridiales bacterium]MDD5809178.1 ribonuclease J [Clostridiales bacterium]MDD5909765.1 ribonuclease J [Clostridiales bacterium]
MAKTAKKLKIIPLGGVGEIGKNMTVIEYGSDIIIVDCGMSFPDEEMPGIDVVIPDMTYIEKNAANVRGILITHGHEDHIGAVPYALQKLNVPVYATKLTIALIEQKLTEIKVDHADLNCVSPGDTIRLGCFSVEFIKTSHSIAGACALAINTPIGTLIHTGDFKVDYTPIDGEPIDIARLAYYGSRGVLALMSDSTNVENEGHTPSERGIGKTFEHCFDKAKGRVIVATFASNIYRIQQIADVAISFGRVVCFQGRSMVKIAEIAKELGYLQLPDESVVEVGQLKKYRDDQICVITTGSQGEPMSGLFRMANSSHKVNVGKGDMVIISASSIPGNEKSVGRVINQLYQHGAKVIYERMADVHVSGHACKEELKLMLTLTKPRFFIPVHGEARHLYQHKELAEELGIPEEDIFVTEIGDVVELTRNKGRIAGSVTAGSVMVDGSGVGDIGNVVLRDRKLLSEDGIFTVVITLNKQTGALLAQPEILSRGFVYEKNSEELLKETRELVKAKAAQFEKNHRSNWSSIKNDIRNSIKNYLYERTKRRPMVMPIIIEI